MDMKNEPTPPEGTEFEPCVRCETLTEIDHLDKLGRCPTCGIASPLRLVQIENRPDDSSKNAQ